MTLTERRPLPDRMMPTAGICPTVRENTHAPSQCRPVDVSNSRRKPASAPGTSRAVLCFATRTKGSGPYQKGRSNLARICLSTARREFLEETGVVAQPPFLALGSIQQKGGKIVHAWAARAISTRLSCEATRSRSNGRRTRAASASSPKSIDSSTSTCRQPNARSRPLNGSWYNDWNEC